MNTTKSQDKAESQWRLILALVMAELTCALESNMLYSAMSTLYKTFGDPAGVGWLITSFLLVSAAAAALCGRLGDLYGRSRVLMIILVVATAGSLLSAFSSSLHWIVAGRALQGVSMAILPLCFGLVRENWPRERVAFGVGLLGATYTIGAGVGYILGGILVDHFSWHWIFYCSASFAVATLVLVWLFVKPSVRNLGEGKLDVLGGILFVPSTALILFSVTNAKGWGEGRSGTMMAGGLLLLALWIAHELRQKHPLINVRLLMNRQIAIGNAALALASCGAFQLMMVVLLLLQQPNWTGVGLGVSATFAAALSLPAVALSAASIVWSGHAAGRRGARHALLYGMALATLGSLGLAIYHQSIWFVVIMLLIAIPGQGIIFGAVPNLIIEAAPVDRTSEATGLSQVVKALFMSVGTQTVSFMLATSTTSDPAQGKGVFPTDAAYTLALVIMTLICVLAIAVTLALPRNKSGAATLGDNGMLRTPVR